MSLSLLKIHNRRRDLLIEQQANLGGRADVSIRVEIESIADEIAAIESTLKRRLQGLREKAALFGISADPSLSIEIEDITAYFDGRKEAEQRSNTNYA